MSIRRTRANTSAASTKDGVLDRKVYEQDDVEGDNHRRDHARDDGRQKRAVLVGASSARLTAPPLSDDPVGWRRPGDASVGNLRYPVVDDEQGLHPAGGEEEAVTADEQREVRPAARAREAARCMSEAADPGRPAVAHRDAPYVCAEETDRGAPL
jgi:hypothetical protein